jgi:hypothetical protein
MDADYKAMNMTMNWNSHGLARAVLLWIERVGTIPQAFYSFSDDSNGGGDDSHWKPRSSTILGLTGIIFAVYLTEPNLFDKEVLFLNISHDLVWWEHAHKYDNSKIARGPRLSLSRTIQRIDRQVSLTLSRCCFGVSIFFSKFSIWLERAVMAGEHR